MTFLHAINRLLDQLFFGLIEPFFILAGRVLEAAILTPLDLLHVPQPVQVMVIASLTGLLSLYLRRKVGLEKHEHLFRHSFAGIKKDQQICMEAVSDDKAREIIQQIGDNELDALYNNYLARRFVENGMAYMLPVLTVLLWLERAFPAGTGSTLLLYMGTYFLTLLIDNLFQRSSFSSTSSGASPERTSSR
jgi:hypothetical protein